MAAPDELFCWEGDWGLPSVSTDCLVVLVSVRSRRIRTGSPDVCQSHSHTEARVYPPVTAQRAAAGNGEFNRQTPRGNR
ncbi:metaxin-1 [Lates japonicus]|uniref:Metaxin-1 n=1 Tax=Lates japonicus TaxID=270547 RepID=A0AAD3MGD9_LATJO|nr:metaxin-1 [Lates japonicus]